MGIATRGKIDQARLDTVRDKLTIAQAPRL